MKGRSPTFTQVPLDIVGSTTFGRYPKISVEETYNMIISDNFLVPFAGHKKVVTINPIGQGRGIYTSTSFGQMIAIIDNTVYAISTNLTATVVGTINTFIGDVYIDENNAHQIAICDRQNIYIYNWLASTFAIATLPNNTDGSVFVPGYISFQNGRFIAPSLNTNIWRLSDPNDGLSWPADSAHQGSLQTKPDNVVAAQRFPGRGNLLFVFGSTVVEPWQDAGLQLFPYLRNNNLNIDYGCLNPATIAYNENIIVWLAANEKSGPAIMYSTGGDATKISTDGIDFRLAQLTNPSNSYGFLFRQDGHVLYQLTFPDDNLTYVFDFNTRKFFTLSDQYLNAHIAKRVAFFNDSYFFVSFNDGNIYELNTKYTTFDGAEIPRIRMCRNIRLPDASRFSVNNLTFTLEEGMGPTVPDPGGLVETTDFDFLDEAGDFYVTEAGDQFEGDIPDPFVYTIPARVDLSVSKDGGQTFGTVWGKELNPEGRRKNRLIYWNLGAANDFVPQLRFWGLGRFVVTDGIVSIFQ